MRNCTRINAQKRKQAIKRREKIPLEPENFALKDQKMQI